MKKLLTGLLLLCFAFAVHAQGKRVIKGKVLSKEDNQPLIGASVLIDKVNALEQSRLNEDIKAYNLGTTTDVNGEFTLEIPSSVVNLVCSYIGYETTKINVKNQSKVTIYLSEDTESLDEIVVTGYGNIDKKKYTGSVSKVRMNDIKQIGVASVENMLEGRIAGVQTTTVSGAPGAPAKIRIRGTSSLNGNQDPLWVIDGMALESSPVPDFSDKDNIDALYNTSIAGLNPQDIENITILKDAASTAIYGARAANGVIVITTKKGKKGKMRVNFNSNTSFVQKADLDMLNLMNSSEKVDFELAMAKRDDLTYRAKKGAISRLLNTSGELSTFRTNGYDALSADTKAAINKLRNTNTNWSDELFQNAVNQDYSLSVSGGTDNANYYASAGYHTEKGTTIGTGLDRYNLTLKTNFNVSDKLKIGVSTFFNRRETESYLTSKGSFTNPSYYSRTVNPYLQIRDEKGQYVYDQDLDSWGEERIPFNIIEERNNTSHKLAANNFNSILDVNYEFNKKFKFTSQIGVQFEDTKTTKTAEEDSYYVRDAYQRSRLYYSSKYKKLVEADNDTRGWWTKEGDDGYFYYLPKGGISDLSTTNFWQYSMKNMLFYNDTYMDGDHSVEAMIGNEIRRNKIESQRSVSYGFDSQTLSSTPIIFPSSEQMGTFITDKQGEIENAYVSYFATLSYTYLSKYTLFGSLRYDGSNLFGADTRDKFTPIWSLSGTWRASEEDFLKNLLWLSNLKFRGSYGIQGNVDRNTTPQIIGEYERINLLGTQYRSIEVNQLPNPYLKWEKTASYNFGVDLGIFNNRIRTSFDIYYRYGSDLIELTPLPLENGYAYTSMNWAEVSNKGFEFSLSTLNVKTSDFQWSTDFNISKNINKVEKQLVRNNSYLPSKEGHSVNSFFVLKTAGLDENGYPQFYNKEGKVVSGNEFFKLFDEGATWEWPFPGSVAGSKLTEKEARELFTYGGTTDPDFMGGMINRFSYKNFDLSISCSFILGQSAVRKPPYHPTNVDRGLNQTTDILNAWTPDKKTDMPRIIGKNTTDGDYWMQHAWYTDLGNYLKPYNSLDIWVKELDYVRVNNIRFGYNLPKSVLDKAGISALKFTVEARNPFVFSTDFDGYFDPESYGNIYAQPLPKSITVGLNLTF